MFSPGWTGPGGGGNSGEFYRVIQPWKYLVHHNNIAYTCREQLTCYLTVYAIKNSKEFINDA